MPQGKIIYCNLVGCFNPSEKLVNLTWIISLREEINMFEITNRE